MPVTPVNRAAKVGPVMSGPVWPSGERFRATCHSSASLALHSVPWQQGVVCTSMPRNGTAALPLQSGARRCVASSLAMLSRSRHVADARRAARDRRPRFPLDRSIGGPLHCRRGVVRARPPPAYQAHRRLSACVFAHGSSGCLIAVVVVAFVALMLTTVAFYCAVMLSRARCLLSLREPHNLRAYVASRLWHDVASLATRPRRTSFFIPATAFAHCLASSRWFLRSSLEAWHAPGSRSRPCAADIFPALVLWRVESASCCSALFGLAVFRWNFYCLVLVLVVSFHAVSFCFSRSALSWSVLFFPVCCLCCALCHLRSCSFVFLVGV